MTRTRSQRSLRSPRKGPRCPPTRPICQNVYDRRWRKRASFFLLPLPARGLFGRSPTHVLFHRRCDRKVAPFRSTPHGESQSCSWRSANLVKRFTPAIFPRMSKRPYGIRLPASGTDCAVSFNPASWMSTPWIEATSPAQRVRSLGQSRMRRPSRARAFPRIAS